MGARTLLLMLVIGAVMSSYSVEGLFGTAVKNATEKAAKYVADFVGGAKDMYRNFKDMKKSNTIGSDKYFHAKGNYEAAKRGTGGKHAATLISNAREAVQLAWGLVKRKHPVKDLVKDMIEDVKANNHGRNGGDPNKYRPKGLPKEYRK